MNRATLLALAERVEAATGADRELDIDIALATIPHLSRSEYGGVVYDNEAVCRKHDPNHRRYIYDTPRYTASLDAAVSLVPWDAYWRLGHDGDGADPAEYKADVIVPKLGGVDARGRAIAVTPPIALTAASLRAIAGSLTE